MSVLKRQRESKKADKAAAKRARRQGIPQAVFTEPRPTVAFGGSSGDRQEEDRREADETDPK
jgi:hypothetical protein